MFETPDTKGESSGMGMWVGILVVLVVIACGVVFFMTRKDATPGAASTSAAAAAPAEANADAMKDLRIVSKKLDKDYTGTTAMWSVEVRNMSRIYSYSNIKYETTYLDASGGGLGDNKGVIPSLTLDPGESQSAQFRDTLYPSGTALYNIKIIGATATK